MNSEKRIGSYTSSYEFFRAYHFGETGLTQIGSISDQISAEELKAFHENMCRLISERTGKPTHKFFGGYYQKHDTARSRYTQRCQMIEEHGRLTSEQE